METPRKETLEVLLEGRLRASMKNMGLGSPTNPGATSSSIVSAPKVTVTVGNVTGFKTVQPSMQDQLAGTIKKGKGIGAVCLLYITMSLWSSHLFSPEKFKTRERLYTVRTKPVISVCVLTKSLASWNSLKDAALQQSLIPSLEHTVSSAELHQYTLRLYVGADHDDAFWIANHKRLTHPSWLHVSFNFYQRIRPNKLPMNEMMQQAFAEGSEYMLRMNDDTEFVTEDWLTLGIKTLRSMQPPNVGVVGPTFRNGNVAIMTHDMVHKTHMRIFPNYYPDCFSNWYVDDWITYVYQPGRSIKLAQWRVNHYVHLHGQRYQAHTQEKRYLADEVSKGKVLIRRWLLRDKDPEPTQALVSNSPKFLNDAPHEHVPYSHHNVTTAPSLTST